MAGILGVMGMDSGGLRWALYHTATMSSQDPRDEIGEMIAVQMTAANVQPDALFVSKVGTGNVDSSDKLIACGTKCVQPYNAGTIVTLTAKPASDSFFLGWSGACSGTALTCSVAVNVSRGSRCSRNWAVRFVGK